MIVKKLNSLEKFFILAQSPAQPPCRIFTFWGTKNFRLIQLIEIWQFHVNLIARVWPISNFGQLLNPQTAPSQTIACKNNETFHIFGHFKVRRPPPCPHDQCWKKWVEFSLFSHSHNIELGGEGGIYVVVSIIFAPDCRSFYLNKCINRNFSAPL
jgi:hypothetical protein